MRRHTRWLASVAMVVHRGLPSRSCRQERRLSRMRCRGWAAAMAITLLATSCAGTTTSSPVRRPVASTPRRSPARPGPAHARPSATDTSEPAGVVTTPETPAAATVPRGTAPTSELVTEPDDGMQPIYSLLSSARRALDMTMYELADPEAVDILEADAARGVVVRVLLDRAYSGAYVNAAAAAELGAHGVSVRWAPPGTIFHQKTITVDDRTSAIMTLNLTSRYYASSRDFAVITTDVADVDAIVEVFNEDWTSSGPPGTGPAATNLVWSPGALAPILALINSAQHSLLIESEEMGDPDVVDALEEAAHRGVSVHVVMTYSPSFAPELTDLADAHVDVSTYASDAPLYIHAKVIVVDGTTAFVGSQNFSETSLDHNRELGIVTRDPSIVESLTHTVSSDVAGATAFDPGSPASGLAPPGTAAGSTGAWCHASASPADDGYAGDYDVSVSSDQPGDRATASDAGDTYGVDTDGSGSAIIRLWHTSPGEMISVTVGAASCSTTA